MSLLDLLGAAVGGGGLGVITGLIGTAVTKYSDFQTKKADLAILKEQNSHARLLAVQEQENNLKLAAMTAKSQERVADINAQARAIEMASLDFRASHESDRATYLAPEVQKQSRMARVLMAVVDFMRGIIRPGCTIWAHALLSILVAWAMFMVWHGKVTLTNDQIVQLIVMIFSTVCFLVTTYGTWWFGIRPNAPPQSARGAPLQMQ